MLKQWKSNNFKAVIWLKTFPAALHYNAKWLLGVPDGSRLEHGNYQLEHVGHLCSLFEKQKSMDHV